MINDHNIDKIYKVVCDETRLDIVAYLKYHKNKTATDLLKVFSKIDQSDLSFHMKKLKSVKLITTKKEGKFIVYNANLQTINDVLDYMDEKIHYIQEHPKHLIFNKQILLETYALYSDPVRKKLLLTIAENPSICGKQLRIMTGESEADVSFHIKKMVDSQIIRCKKIGNQHYYWPNIRFAVEFHEYVKQIKENDILNKLK